VSDDGWLQRVTCFITDNTRRCDHATEDRIVEATHSWEIWIPFQVGNTPADGETANGGRLDVSRSHGNRIPSQGMLGRHWKEDFERVFRGWGAEDCLGVACGILLVGGDDFPIKLEGPGLNACEYKEQMQSETTYSHSAKHGNSQGVENEGYKTEILDAGVGQDGDAGKGNTISVKGVNS
jgi:hypothetical protein